MQPKRHRQNPLICDINVAAFASVMLALLYLFMSPKFDGYCGRQTGKTRW